MSSSTTSSLPQPQVALDDICAVIHDNTLYTYSAEAFQALPLMAGAQWSELPQGEKVTGGLCVGSTPGNDSNAGFWVIGGTIGGTSGTYQGLQKYTYSAGSWESIPLPTPVLSNRLGHGAAYMNKTDSFLIYAGSREEIILPSTETFTVQASSPYAVVAYSSVAPPVTDPILLTWSDNQVAMVGGSNTNTKVMLFSPEQAWKGLGATLSAPLQNFIQAQLVTADDGSKHLFTFDMTQSPNIVSRIPLLDGQGQPVNNQPSPVQKRSSPEASRHRQGRIKWQWRRDLLTYNNWPDYNSANAPSTTRDGYAVAEDPNGFFVIAGGDDQDVLCMFDGRQNAWQNSTARLVPSLSIQVAGDNSSAISTPSEPSASSVVQITPAPAPSTPLAEAESSPTSASMVLGVVFGILGGIAGLLALIYCFVRRARRKQARMRVLRNAEPPTMVDLYGRDEKMALGLGVYGTGSSSFLPSLRGHHPQGSQTSLSSMAILLGRANQGQVMRSGPQGKAPSPFAPPRPAYTDEQNDGQRRSTASDIFAKPIWTFNKTKNSRNSSTAEGLMNTTPTPARSLSPLAGNGKGEGEARRSSGWNRYWSGGSPLNILGFNSSKDHRRSDDGDDRHASNNYSRSSTTSGPSDVHRSDSQRSDLTAVELSHPTYYGQVPGHNPQIALGGGLSGVMDPPISHRTSSPYSSHISSAAHNSWDLPILHFLDSRNAPTTMLHAPPRHPASSSDPSCASSQIQPPPPLAVRRTSPNLAWVDLNG